MDDKSHPNIMERGWFPRAVSPGRRSVGRHCSPGLSQKNAHGCHRPIRPFDLRPDISGFLGCSAILFYEPLHDRRKLVDNQPRRRKAGSRFPQQRSRSLHDPVASALPGQRRCARRSAGPAWRALMGGLRADFRWERISRNLWDLSRRPRCRAGCAGDVVRSEKPIVYVRQNRTPAPS